MCLQTLATRVVPTREERLGAIGDLHALLDEGFVALCESNGDEWGPADPAQLHCVMDRLVENVGSLTQGAAPAVRESRLELSPTASETSSIHSLTAMLERLSGLVDSTREAALTAAEFRDWGLTDELAELAQRFEESLWFMVVSIHDGLNAATANDRPESGSKT